jgi:ribosome-associated protein
MDSSLLVKLAAVACDDIKAGNIKLLKVDEVTSLADWILITEGLSDVQVRAIVNNVEKTLKEEADILPIRKEGINEAKWALLDYGDLIINVMQPNERKFYDLESFWSNGVIHDFTNNKLNALKDE